MPQNKEVTSCKTKGGLETSPLQIYSGYVVEDLEIIQKYSSLEAYKDDDYYSDGFGVKTLFDCVPFVKPAALNLQRLELPVPDDGYHAETIEYVALTDALHRAQIEDSFCAVEIGAAWGPWITAAGVIACKRNCKSVKLVGVEASSNRFPLLCRHLEENGLRRPGFSIEDQQHKNVFTRLFNGAAWTHDGEIWFPDSNIIDMGAAASSTNNERDYRDAPLENKSVPCKRLDTLLSDIGPIDFMHIDIQGAEVDLIQDQIEWITRNIKTLMIATHSRSLEGKLIDLLFAHGWQLHREKPCRVDWGRACSLVGRTTVDGSQYWINSSSPSPTRR